MSEVERLRLENDDLKSLCFEAATAISSIECFLRDRNLLGEARASTKTLDKPHIVVDKILKLRR